MSGDNPDTVFRRIISERKVMRLKDKIAVIVGGGSGMGAAVARLFAKQGASVIVGDIDEDAASKVVKSITDTISSARAINRKVDVTDKGSVERLAQFIRDEMGPADILVNTFGIAAFVPMLELSFDTWRSTIDVNLTGTFLTCRAIGRQMVEQQRGKIINVGSTASFSGVPGMVHYTAAKHGVLGLTRALAVEWGKYNIHVNCICPGATTTPLMLSSTTEPWRADRKKRIPTGRLSSPENQAHVALFLASAESDNLSGAGIPTDGGVHAMAAATSNDALASN